MASQSIASTTLVLFAFGMIVMAEETQRPLFDFTGKDSAKEWQTVNDGVMGGLSEGKFKITDQKTLEFSGNLSLKNNGGFASVRTKSKKLTLDSGDTIVARVLKDARPVTPQDVNAVGWMLSDKQAGPFEMEIEWIKVERTVGAL